MAQKSNPGFELFSQLIIAFLLSNQVSEFSNLGFKTQVFNSQFLTQTDISFSRSNPKMAIFWFTLKSPLTDRRGFDIFYQIVAVETKIRFFHS